MKQNFVFYEFTDGKNFFLLTLDDIAIRDNDLQPFTVRVGGISFQFRYLVVTKHWSKL
jgi:hypothetical protein